MIRLIHQFDDPRAQATVASPTIAACCCSSCCCCIVMTLGACALTARAVGKGIDRMNAVVPVARREVVPEANFREPAVRDAAVVVRAPPRGAWMFFAAVVPLAPVGALAAGFGMISNLDSANRSNFEWVPFAMAFATYVSLCALLYRFTRVNRLYLVLLPFVWFLASCGEAWLWVTCLMR